MGGRPSPDGRVRERPPAEADRPREFADEFDLKGELPAGMVVLEASAGTGKTFTLTALVARFIAERGVRVDELLMVTFTRAAAAEMRERTRSKLLEARAALREAAAGDADWLGPLIDCDDRERALRIERVEAAIAGLDDAMITTIHGFCQATLSEMGLTAGDASVQDLESGADDLVSSSVREALVRRLTLDPDALRPSKPSNPGTIEASVRKVVTATSTQVAVTMAPGPGAAPEEAIAWRSLAEEILDRVRSERRHAGIATFDDLITGVDTMMADEVNGPAVLERLRRRYRVVLVDEFQDTDVVQWRIFRRAFVDDEVPGDRPVVICVGDPKQAIYRFRGADIDAYLRAVSEPGAVTSTMRTNFRTDTALVNATNVLMQDLDLGRGRVKYVEVRAKNVGPSAIDDHIPLEVRWLPSAEPIAGSSKQSATAIRRRIAEDLAEHVLTLLTDRRLSTGDGDRAVGPRDIAVLLRSNGDADHIVSALKERGIPTVRTRIGSVIDSPAMDQLRLLAAALAAPSDRRSVRALGFGWFAAIDESLAIDPADDERNARLHQMCAGWAATLERDGIHGLFGELKAGSRLLAVLRSEHSVERSMTDLEHLVELIHQRTGGRGLSAAGFARSLEELADSQLDAEVALRRTDSAADAVTITSMHGAKGLEYPIVLLPYPKQNRNEPPFVFTDGDARLIDAAPLVDWAVGDLNATERKRRASAEIDEDERRLIYVAMTRAKHRLVVWWARSRGVDKGALARVLFHDPHRADAAVPKDDDDVATALKELASRVRSAGSRLEVVRIAGSRSEVEAARPEYRPPEATLAELIVNPMPASAVSRPGWYRWSFTSLTRRADGAAGGAYEVSGLDEGGGGPSVLSSESGSDRVDGALLDMPASAAFGVLIHEVLEGVDFASTDLDGAFARIIADDPRLAVLGVDSARLSRGLAAVARTPLGSLFGDACLAGLGAADRLAELEFNLSLGRAGDAIPRSAFLAAAIANEPPAIAACFADIAAEWRGGRVGGLLVGSIDALLRLDGRFYVVDYKSNRLHPRDAPARQTDYGYPAMLDAVRHHEYLLQALIYTVATHRFLEHRLRGYDPAVHLGGVGYLFVRGMTGPSTPVIDGVTNGVFGWRPTIETVVATDRALGGGQ